MSEEDAGRGGGRSIRGSRGVALLAAGSQRAHGQQIAVTRCCCDLNRRCPRPSEARDEADASGLDKLVARTMECFL